MEKYIYYQVLDEHWNEIKGLECPNDGEDGRVAIGIVRRSMKANGIKFCNLVTNGCGDGADEILRITEITIK